MSIVSEFRAALGWRNNGDAEGFKLARAYRATRARLMAGGHNASPARCLSIARADVARGASFYPATSANAGEPGERGGRWCERPEALGLRFVGFADECGGRSFRRVDHSGWYLSPDGDESAGLARGCVYQLPARGGRSVYVEALRTGERNRDGEWCDFGTAGGALVFFGERHLGEPGGRDCDTEPAMLEAASGADEEARFYAEREKDWRAASEAGRMCAEADATVKSERAEARRLVRELRQVRRELSRPFPALCDALRSAIRLHLEKASEAAERARGYRSDFANCPKYGEAFAEGLGE